MLGFSSKAVPLATSKTKFEFHQIVGQTLQEDIRNGTWLGRENEERWPRDKVNCNIQCLPCNYCVLIEKVALK